MAKKRLKRIKIEFAEMRTTWGVAYPDEHRIVLDPRMDDVTMIEVASHEVAHVCCPYLEEDTVELLGRQIAATLARLGFKRSEDMQ
jgi:predicted SprT family Zn-dependent metalloprotease